MNVINTMDNSSIFTVRLSYKTVAMVTLREADDNYVPNIVKKFPPGLLVTGRVIDVNEERKSIHLSLRVCIESRK